ncbi:OsmC/Ohr family [Apodospora peruviana]|uniref:OsmC/Ohr family n=1 Tax=Apodospora peruviana TaxID=516989 RepID=A0AAE0IJ91_9PEZI|nr:OsmC/Ohr family [Apodospora peruviana]
MFQTRLIPSLTRGAAAPRQRQQALSAVRMFSVSALSRQKVASIPIVINGTGTGTTQTVSVPGKPYTFSTDTYPTLGGQDSAPSPVAYSLASLGSCNQVTGGVVARDHGIKLGEWNVSVEGDLPIGVLVHGEQGDPNWLSIKLKVRVQTDTTDEKKFGYFVQEVERRCPITQLFKLSGVRYESEWVNEGL